MSITVITTFPEKAYKVYAQRMIESFIECWPKNIKLHVYYEGQCPPINDSQVKYIDLHKVSPELVAFKNKHKNDPVANGQVEEIPGGVRRVTLHSHKDKMKGSFLWDACLLYTSPSPRDATLSRMASSA